MKRKKDRPTTKKQPTPKRRRQTVPAHCLLSCNAAITQHAYAYTCPFAAPHLPTPYALCMTGPIRHAQVQQNVPLPTPPVASDDEVSDEDLDFVSQLGAPGLAFLASLDQDALDR